MKLKGYTLDKQDLFKLLMVGICLCIVFVFRVTIKNICDDIIMLENKHSSYWDLIGKRSPYNNPVLKKNIDYEGFVFGEDDYNILDEYDWIEGELSGLSFVRKNDKIIIDGVVEDKVWLNITKGRIFIEPGTYYVTAGHDYPACFIYLEGWKNGSNSVLAKALGSGFFTVVDEEYPEGYSFTMAFQQGASFHKTEIIPRLIKVSDECVDIEDDILVSKAYYINSEDWNAFSSKEKKIVMNQLKYEYPDAPWSSIIFDDGKGIQYKDGTYKEGKISCFGVVYDY